MASRDPSVLPELRTGADGFREELLKQGTAVYCARPSCADAVEELLRQVEPALRRLERPSAEEEEEVAKPGGLGRPGGAIKGFRESRVKKSHSREGPCEFLG